MQTLAQLQARMAGTDVDDALAAANELTNYFIIYNEEYNALLIKHGQAKSSLFDATHDPAGVDHAEVLSLQGLILGLESRMRVLDAKMLAFQASTLSINPPDAVLVGQVKQLTAAVAVLVTRDQNLQAIMLSLGQIAALVNQTHGA